MCGHIYPSYKPSVVYTRIGNAKRITKYRREGWYSVERSYVRVLSYKNAWIMSRILRNRLDCFCEENDTICVT